MATRLRDLKRRALETLQRAAARGSADDPGLKEIADWHRWFVEGHTARLADLNLPRDQYDAQLADVTRIAAAVTDRMRSDYLARKPQS